jgi:hypothetical protein
MPIPAIMHRIIGCAANFRRTERTDKGLPFHVFQCDSIGTGSGLCDEKPAAANKRRSERGAPLAFSGGDISGQTGKNHSE